MSPDPSTAAVTGSLAAPATGDAAASAVEGVDIPALRQDLLGDQVAAPADQVPALRQVVEYARSEGHDVSFVVLDTVAPKFTYYRDIATALQKDTGGTVIVLAPNSVGSASTEFTRVQQEQATDNLTLQDPPLAARQMFDQMAEPGVNWTIVTLVLIAVIGVGAVVARLRQVRDGARRGRGAAPSADRVGDEAPDNSAADGAAAAPRPRA